MRSRARSCLRAWVVLPFVLLAGCGGGGGGGSSSGGSSPAPVVPTPASIDIGARMSAMSLSVERDVYQRGGGDTASLKLLVDRLPADGYYYRVTNTAKAISSVSKTPMDDGSVDIRVSLSGPDLLAAGVYDDTVTVEVCLDSQCQRPALGSPFVVAVRLSLGFHAPTEAGQTPLSPQAAQTLTHDLVAAAYSARLDAVVMVAKTPSPALHVRDLTTGLSRSVVLATAPTSVAISPDGLSAAVGHDGAVSLVDLGATLSVKRFPVSGVIGAVVLDGSGRIFGFDGGPATWMPVHWVDVAVGTDMSSTDKLYGNGFPMLHPAGDRIYTANRGVSPSDIVRVSLDGSGVAAVKDSPYHGEYEMCGQVWPASSGNRLYTACGNVFGTSSDVSLDMRYAGSFPLSAKTDTAPYGYAAVSVSDSPANDRLIVLEQDKYSCDPRIELLHRCFTRVGTYSASTLSLLSRATLSPVTAGADRFAQIGRYVFQRADGRAVLLSELRGAPATSSVLIGTLP